MLKNYLKIILRNTIRQRGYTFINISGLAIGLACFILILLWVQDELSYDRFYSDSENLYRVVENQFYAGGEIFPVAVTPAPLAAALKNEYPEIINSCRIKGDIRLLVQNGDIRNYEDGGALADPSFLELFNVEFIKGNRETALNELTSVVLTEDMAARYFGDENPLGKTIRIENQFDFTITGVIKNVPANTHLQYTYLAPFLLFKKLGRNLEEWGSNSFYTYVQVESSASISQLDEKIKDIIKRNAEGSVTEIYLQPIKNIHLHSDFAADVGGLGDILYVNIFIVIALVVLLIACINFMNLSTARSVNRAREVGLRKTIGASRLKIMLQYFSESLFFSFLALIIAGVVVELILPLFNQLAGKQLNNIFINPGFVGALIGITFLTGMIAGSYPAVVLSSYHPIDVLKGTFISGTRGAFFRKVLVVLQFTLSIILIISTIVVSTQLGYINNRKLGLNKEQVLCVSLKGKVQENFETAKSELLNKKGILSVSCTSELPVNLMSSTSGFDWEGKNPDDKILMHIVSVDEDYQRLFKMEIADGRFFSKDFSSDTSSAFVLNETAIKMMKMENPVGKRFKGFGNEGRIIGVVKDFNFKPVNKMIEPLVMAMIAEWRSWMLIRIPPGDIPQTIGEINKVWSQFNPQYPFEYKFLDDDFQKIYSDIQQMNVIFNYFTFLAIFISALGLLGLASFIIERRTKEIGIRKVMGARVSEIVLLLSKEFSKWVFLANLFAWPVAWFVMSKWLENFAYRTNLHIWTFLVSGLAALIVALLTVSVQTIKASMVNPAKVLKYE